MNVTARVNGRVVSSPELERRSVIASEVKRTLADGGTADTGSICPVKHMFANGLYCREIFIPKGVKIIGKIHATQHFNTILTGECLVITTKQEKHIKAPHTFVSEAGEQKAVLALTDVTWQTYHVTDKTDPAEIEKEVISESWEDFEKLEGVK